MRMTLTPEVLARLKELKENEIERLSYKMIDPLMVCIKLEQEGLFWF